MILRSVDARSLSGSCLLALLACAALSAAVISTVYIHTLALDHDRSPVVWVVLVIHQLVIITNHSGRFRGLPRVINGNYRATIMSAPSSETLSKRRKVGPPAVDVNGTGSAGEGKGEGEGTAPTAAAHGNDRYHVHEPPASIIPKLDLKAAPDVQRKQLGAAKE